MFSYTVFFCCCCFHTVLVTYLHKCVCGKCGGVFVLAGNNNKYYYLSYNKKVIETSNGNRKKRKGEREKERTGKCKNKTGHSEKVYPVGARQETSLESNLQQFTLWPTYKFKDVFCWSPTPEREWSKIQSRNCRLSFVSELVCVWVCGFLCSFTRSVGVCVWIEKCKRNVNKTRPQKSCQIDQQIRI